MNDFVDIFENHLIGFKVNDKEVGDDSTIVYRVLWRDSDKLIWVNIFNDSFPEQVDVAYVKQKIGSGECFFIKNDPWQVLSDTDLEVDQKKIL